jgi:hypothetical protein
MLVVVFEQRWGCWLKMSELPIAFILLDRAVEPDMSSVVEALRTRHPQLRTGLAAAPSGVGAKARSHLLQCGDGAIAVMSMPAPIPEDQGLWARSATSWPEAAAIAARHQAHVIVSPLDHSTQRLSEARTVTAAIGALIAVTPGCSAVVWRAKVARPAKLWLEMSKRSFAPFPDYPFTLWFDALPFQSGAMIGAVTMGVSAFAGREIEFEAERLSLPAVMDNVVGLAAYLIEHGAVLKDGDTFGGDETERFKVRFRHSTRFPGLPVFFCSTPLAS